MKFDANTSWTQQTGLCNKLQGRVHIDSTRQMWAFLRDKLHSPWHYQFIIHSLYSVSVRAQEDIHPWMCFVPGAFAKGTWKLNFNRCALAFTPLPCPWVEHRPPTRELRAQHLRTTVAFTFPWSSSLHSFINTHRLQLFKSFAHKWGRQTIVKHLWKYMCPSLNEWRLIKPCDWLWERQRQRFREGGEETGRGEKGRQQGR